MDTKMKKKTIPPGEEPLNRGLNSIQIKGLLEKGKLWDFIIDELNRIKEKSLLIKNKNIYCLA